MISRTENNEVSVFKSLHDLKKIWNTTQLKYKNYFGLLPRGKLTKIYEINQRLISTK